ncbi:MAG: DUF3471 domain-containing protein [Terriglobales bacterium]|jgi:hypothetical protein
MSSPPRQVSPKTLVSASKRAEGGLGQSSLFDGYVGRYELAPNFILSVKREGNQLFVQATGQPKFELFPESEREYFYKVADAQITFDTGSHGKATGLVLHQGGMNQPAKRIE